MSATDFLPRREADLRVWSINFNAKINTDPTAYGLSAPQAADYAAKNNLFLDAYQTTNDPATRSSASIIAKNNALLRLRKLARQLVAVIQSKSVSDMQKSDLGITLRRPGGRQALIPRPNTAPSLHIKSQVGSRVTFRMHDLSNPTRKGRPTGVSGATIMSYIGESPPADMKEWSFVRNTTRMVNTMTLPNNLQPGTKIWLTACWFNPRAEGGPMAQPISTYTQYGGTVLPAIETNVQTDDLEVAA